MVGLDSNSRLDVPQSLKTIAEPISLKNSKAALILAVYILTVEKGKKPKEDSFAVEAKRAKQRKWIVLQLEADHNPRWSATEKLEEALY